MKLDVYTSIIIEYGQLYEKSLKLGAYSQNEVERKLNEWIIDKLHYVKDNPNITEKELINYILKYNKERTMK